MMWDDSHTDHVRVSVRDTRSEPLWIENRVIHISGISRWISTRLIHLVGINECITWGYPLACVNVNLPLGKQRATGTFVVEKLRTFPRSDARRRGGGEGRIRVTHSPAHMPWISSRDKLDPAKAQLRGVSKWTLSRPGVTIQALRASIGRRNGRIHREKRPFRHARSHTRSRARSRPLRVARSCSKAGRFRADYRPDLLQPQRQRPNLPSLRETGLREDRHRADTRAGTGPRQPPPGQPTGTTRADRTHGLARCADRVAA